MIGLRGFENRCECGLELSVCRVVWTPFVRMLIGVRGTAYHAGGNRFESMVRGLCERTL
jgi:hypothetical protein